VARTYGLPDGSVFRCLLEWGEEVIVSQRWRAGVEPENPRHGECTATAFSYLAEHPRIRGLRMVHGSIFSLGEGRRIAHAWVELGGSIVFDGVLQRFYTRDSYRRIAQAAAGVAYTRAEVLRGFEHWKARQEIRTHPHGPWPDKDPEGQFCTCEGHEWNELGVCSAYRERKFKERISQRLRLD
jgi:hypothetical protein